MNKQQISYFENRTRVAVNEVMDKVHTQYPSLPSLTTEQIVGHIYAGNARFRSEVFMGENCQRVRNSNPHSILAELFELPGEDERISKNQRRDEIINGTGANSVVSRVKAARSRLLDAFVMGTVTDPVAALEEFVNTDFLTEAEHAELARLTTPGGNNGA